MTNFSFYITILMNSVGFYISILVTNFSSCIIILMTNVRTFIVNNFAPTPEDNTIVSKHATCI
jgi:hypothetical protein